MAEASYISLWRSGELEQRAAELHNRLSDCDICPHNCKVDRLAGNKGNCNAPADIYISSVFPHYGEEPELVGVNGSGTIFMTYCNMQCEFCQNYTISHQEEGNRVTEDELANAMLQLQVMGCHNINFVTPTHYVPQIVKAISIAAEKGLSLPLVYNSSGYDSVDTLKMLEGIIDIYMPDTKFADDRTGCKYMIAQDYADKMFEALQEMHRQVGDLDIDKFGLAQKGLLVRHLVMPDGIAGTGAIMKFLAEKLSKDTYVNIMGQYRPCYRANQYPELSRPVTRDEMKEAYDIARKYGLHRGF